MNDLIIIPDAADTLLARDVRNPVELLLADKRSAATKRAYRLDLHDFFGGPPETAAVQAFLILAPPQIALRLAAYKGDLLARGLAEATVNRRLAAVRSLLRLSHRLGLTATDGRGLVDGERARAYRDTRGIDVRALKRLLALPDRTTLRGRRDHALLRLLCENALRRAEVCALDVADFDLAGRRLAIRGKGRGTQKEPVTLSARCAGAISAYQALSGHAEGALFRSFDHRPRKQGERLSADGLYHLIGEYGDRLGLKLTPHKLRHSALTAALDATGGDVRRVQKLSRHKDVRTLMIYDDNRADAQGSLSTLLSKLL